MLVTYFVFELFVLVYLLTIFIINNFFILKCAFYRIIFSQFSFIKGFILLIVSL